MTKILNKETGKYEPITKPEDLPSASWAEVVSCGGDEKMLKALYERRGKEKERIIEEMKSRGLNTVKDYYIVKEELAL